MYPWVHQYYNHMTSADQVRAACFPDADPTEVPSDAQFSMAAGNFVEVYSSQGAPSLLVSLLVGCYAKFSRLDQWIYLGA